MTPLPPCTGRLHFEHLVSDKLLDRNLVVHAATPRKVFAHNSISTTQRYITVNDDVKGLAVELV